MKKTLLIVSVAALSVALLASVALAQGRRGRGQGPPGDADGCRGPACMIEELGLSEDQVAAIEALREAHQEQLQALQAERQAVMEEMRALAENESATIEDVEFVEDKLVMAQRAIRSERRFFRAQVYDLLTPEQQAQVPNAWRLGLDRPHGRRGHGNRHGRMGRGGGRGWQGGDQAFDGGGRGRGRHGRGYGQGWQGGQESFDLDE